MNSYQKQTQWIAAGILSLLGPLAFPSLSPGDALDTLHLRNPLPTPDALQSIGFGDNKFIAADNRGDIFASQDGVTWTAIGNVGTELLTEIVFGSGRYVAYSFSSEHFLSSEDGASWTLRASVPPFTFWKLAYGNGLFVSVGGSQVMSSPDGISWTPLSTACNCLMGSVTFGNGMFAAVSSTTSSIYTSIDGVTWTPHVPDAGYSVGSYIAYGNGKFVVSGGTRSGTLFTPGVWGSINGADWLRLSSVRPGADGLLYGDGTFLTWNLLNVITSPDGVAWTTNALPAGPEGVSLQNVSYGNGIFVSVRNGTVGRSVNGTDWAKVTVPAADRSFASSAGAYGAGRYVLVGPFLVTSTDGVNFIQNTNISTSTALNSVIYSANQFIAVGPSGGIIRSSDGGAWSASRSGTLQSLNAIAYGAGRYVAVGDNGVIRISEDGVLWNGTSSGTDYPLHGVTFADGKFVAVGQLGLVLTSSDGIIWAPQNNSDFSKLYQVIHAQGQFLAVGEGGAVLTSTDGVAWIRHASGFTNAFRSVTYAEGLYVAVSSSPVGTYDNNGKVYTSLDGITWQERFQQGFGKIYGAVFLNDAFLLTGYGGTILQSDPVGGVMLRAAANPNSGAFEVNVSSDDIGATYRLQSCTNLAVGLWSDVTTFTQTQYITTVIVPNGAGTPQCYYRTTAP